MHVSGWCSPDYNCFRNSEKKKERKINKPEMSRERFVVEFRFKLALEGNAVFC